MREEFEAIVHMFMGADIPIATQASGGVYNYKDGRTAPDTINVLLEYPQQFARQRVHLIGIQRPEMSASSRAPAR